MRYGLLGVASLGIRTRAADFQLNFFNIRANSWNSINMTLPIYPRAESPEDISGGFFFFNFSILGISSISKVHQYGSYKEPIDRFH